jgi:hypothetical protein
LALSDLKGSSPLTTTTNTIRSPGNLSVSEQASAERRQFRRKAVLWAATIETAALGAFDCITFDLSLGGARLRCAQAIGLLERVTLVIDRYGRFPAEVIWTTPNEIGLQFCEPPEVIATRLGPALPLGGA